LVSDRARVEGWLATDRSNLSETSFANLYLFRDTHAYQLVDGPLPHLIGRTYDGQAHVTLLSPPARAEIAMALLHDGACLYPVGDAGLAAFEGLVVSTTREDDWDYVYEAEAMATLGGRRSRNKRAQARRFESEQSPDLITLDGADAAATRDAIAVLDGWMADSDKPWAETDYAACREGLEQARALGLWGFVVRGHGKPCGLVLADRLPGGAVCVHFAKGRRDQDGVFPFMFSRLAARVGKGLINFEQDLGNPGFRQSKLAYDPIARLRKHRLSPRMERREQP
jgi:hypothetical protein